MSDPLLVAWAAGVLEGEGCFSIFHRKTATQDHKSVAIHCEMTDEDTILKLQSVFDVGTINVRENNKGRVDKRPRKKTWIWSVQNKAGVSLVCKAILPLMSERRTLKIKEILDHVEG